MFEKVTVSRVVNEDDQQRLDDVVNQVNAAVQQLEEESERLPQLASVHQDAIDKLQEKLAELNRKANPTPIPIYELPDMGEMYRHIDQVENVLNQFMDELDNRPFK